MDAMRDMVLLALAMAMLRLATLGVVGVQITDLRVPHEVKNGSTSPAVLDCLYTLRPEESSADAGLVVKWFFNNSPEPVYQWIPGEKPQDLGILRGRLKLGHRASNNRATMHRALYIVNPTTELTGEYRCSVSTFNDEDFMTKKMIVSAPVKFMKLQPSKPSADSVNMSCRAEGVYPEPKMTLYSNADEKHTEKALDGVTVTSSWRGDAIGYEITAYKVLKDEDLEQPAVFGCELKVPSTGYSVHRKLVYYPGADFPMMMMDSGVPRRQVSVVAFLALVLAAFLGHRHEVC